MPAGEGPVMGPHPARGCRGASAGLGEKLLRPEARPEAPSVVQLQLGIDLCALAPYLYVLFSFFVFSLPLFVGVPLGHGPSFHPPSVTRACKSIAEASPLRAAVQGLPVLVDQRIREIAPTSRPGSVEGGRPWLANVAARVTCALFNGARLGSDRWPPHKPTVMLGGSWERSAGLLQDGVTAVAPPVHRVSFQRGMGKGALRT